MGRRTIFTMLAALVGCAVLLGSAWGAEVPRMGIDELKHMEEHLMSPEKLYG